MLDRRGLGFVLFVLQILSFLPPNLLRDTESARLEERRLFSRPRQPTSLSFSGIAFHTSANFLLSSPKTADTNIRKL